VNGSGVAPAAPFEDGERYRTVLETIDEPTVLYDVVGEELVPLLMNAAARRLMGMDVEEYGKAIKSEFTNLIAENGSPLVQEEIPAVIAARTGRRVVGPVNGHRDEDGSVRWFRPTASPILGPDRAVAAVVTIAVDVTEARNAQAELARQHELLSVLVESLQTAVVVEDQERKVLLVNQAFCDLFELDITPAEAVGRTFNALGYHAADMVADPPDAAEVMAERMRARRAVSGDRVTLAGGRVLDRDYIPFSVGDHSIGHLWLFRDVTAEVEAQAERDRLLGMQRRELRRLAELHVLKNEEMATIAHELRTPLTSISGFTELLRDSVDPATTAESAGHVDIILRNVRQLERLSSDLLLLDRIETGTVNLSLAPIDLPDQLRQTVDAMRLEAEAKGVTLTADVDEGPEILGDRQRLIQVFTNLISNAIKFTPAGGSVTVRAKPVGTGWVVTVADTGIGIPEAELVHVYSRFFRGSNALASGREGRGLGLSIAHAIVAMHGGEVTVASAVGSGTTFRVALPGSRPPG
jgi:PAS domain S-box-containing protein